MSAGRRPLAPALRASIGLHALAPLAWLAHPQAWPWLCAGLAADHAALTAAGLWPRSTLLGPNLRRLPAAAARRREICLTFDDGPDPQVTPRVLDLLEAAGAHASFFCIGQRARAHPALVRDILRRGHSVENHTDTHPNGFACYTPHHLRAQVMRAQASLSDIAGTQPRFFRAPMGLRSPLLDPVLAGTDLAYVSWTRRALDGVRCEPAAALRRLTRGLSAGDVLVMHDGQRLRHARGAPVLAFLPGLLGVLDAAGLRSVTLPAACRAAGPGGAPPGDAAAAPSPSA